MTEIRKTYQLLSFFSDPCFGSRLHEYGGGDVIVICQAVNAAETIAVTVGSKIRVPTLNDKTFFQVDVVQTEHAGMHLREQLLSASYRVLADERDPRDEAIGLVYVHPDVNEMRTLYSDAGFYLFGFSKKGNPLYVKYFSGVRI